MSVSNSPVTGDFWDGNMSVRYSLTEVSAATVPDGLKMLSAARVQHRVTSHAAHFWQGLLMVPQTNSIALIFIFLLWIVGLGTCLHFLPNAIFMGHCGYIDFRGCLLASSYDKTGWSPVFFFQFQQKAFFGLALAAGLWGWQMLCASSCLSWSWMLDETW